MMAAQQPVITAYRQLMDDGLELLRDRPASARDRLRETRRLYAFFEREYPRLLDRFLAGETDRRGRRHRDRHDAGGRLRCATPVSTPGRP